MHTEPAASPPPATRGRRIGAVLTGILAGSLAVLLLALLQPAPPRLLAFLLPWDWSPTLLAGLTVAAVIYARGLHRARITGRRPGFWKPLSFYLGLGLIYLVTQTHFDYYAQHMFFMHRAQHLVLHHLGPFLLALAAPLDLLRLGAPALVRNQLLPALRQFAPLRYAVAALQNAIVAPLLFVGLIFFWLLPGLHFDAMISGRLYQVMNTSMLVDGLLFWFLMLDPRPRPPARSGYGARIIALCAVMPPQIVLGASIGLSHTDLYPVYRLCGRAFDLSAIVDQQIGGLITWIPACMMSVIGALVVLRMLLTQDQQPAGDAAPAGRARPMPPLPHAGPDRGKQRASLRA